MPDLVKEVENLRKKKPKLLDESREVEAKLLELEKQVRLAKQVRELDLEDTKISKRANEKLVDTLSFFTKNLERIYK